MAHRFTKPLLEAEDGLPVYSDGYRLIALVETYWIVAGTPLRLDEWQKHLLIRILERCPPGHPREGRLRYDRVVVSIPRQAGKSLLAAVLSIYGLLMHSPAPKVLGVARTAKQGDIVYGYARDAINQSEALSGVLRTTGTRGITKTQGLGTYVVLAAKEESVQGFMATLAIADELHVLDERIWDAMVAGGQAQVDPLLVGITTAGDITSTLLKRLYKEGEAAIAGEQETFGFFVYEAADAEHFTVEAIADANPAVACGRISAESVYQKYRQSPPAFWKRFILNRFVDGLAEPWVPIEDWAKCAGTGLTDFKGCTYAIEVGPMNQYATIYAAKRVDGKVKTATVARLVKPSYDQLKAWALKLKKGGKCQFVVDGYRSRALIEFIESKGGEVLNVGQRRAAAANDVYAAIKAGQVEHDNNAVVNTQHALARTKNNANTDTFVIVSGGHDIDACYASVYAIYGALITPERSLGIA